jgi:predicted acyl esterase
MTLANRIAKKIRRRLRVKGTRIRPTAGLTVAELLIQSWYGKPIVHEPITSQATLWARDRITAHKMQWAHTPVSTKVSRQVRRRRAMARI